MQPKNHLLHMKEKKLPDSYVVDRRLKSYPTEIGSINFKVDDGAGSMAGAGGATYSGI